MSAPDTRTPCKWAQNEDGQWETSCGEMFEFYKDGPRENHARFCLYCGGKIVAKKVRHD